MEVNLDPAYFFHYHTVELFCVKILTFVQDEKKHIIIIINFLF